MDEEQLAAEIRKRVDELGESVDEASRFVFEREEKIRRAIQAQRAQAQSEAPQPSAGPGRLAPTDDEASARARRARNVEMEYRRHIDANRRDLDSDRTWSAGRVLLALSGLGFVAVALIAALGHLASLAALAQSDAGLPSMASPQGTAAFVLVPGFLLGFLGTGVWLCSRSIWPKKPKRP